MRVGIAVLLLHAPADSVLQRAKLWRLVKQPLLMNVCFGWLVVVWFVTRLVIFPLHCIQASVVEFPQQHGGYSTRTDVLICCVLMGALFILHIHWFWLIIQAVSRALSGKGTEDPRSDNEADGEAAKK